MTNLLCLYGKLDSRRVEASNSPNVDCVGVMENSALQSIIWTVWECWNSANRRPGFATHYLPHGVNEC